MLEGYTADKASVTGTMPADDVTITVTYTAIITEAEILGIIAPAAGAAPQNLETLTAGKTSYTVTGLIWLNNDGLPATLTPGGKFKAGSAYQATIELTAATGCKFQALTPTVNSGIAREGTVNEDAQGNKLTFTLAFDDTEAQSVTAIAVKAQPTKLIYTEGEALDLNGLEVVLTYNDGITKVIAYDQFEANNITANPANGTVMTAEEHNEKAITLTCNNHAITTNPLTVNSYVISLSETDIYTFSARTAGYDSVEPVTVTVSRTGTGTITNLAVDISGNDANDFIIEPLDATTLDGSTAFANFTIKPKNALAADSYSAVVTVTADHDVSREFKVSFTVNSRPSRRTSMAIANNGFNILINGKAEIAATGATVQEDGKMVTTIVVDNEKVQEKIQKEGNNSVVTIPVDNGADVVVCALNGQIVKNMERQEAILEMKVGQVIYTLPAAQININAVSAQIGEQVELKDIDVNIKIWLCT